MDVVRFTTQSRWISCNSSNRNQSLFLATWSKNILTDDYRLFSKLFISCQLRECDHLQIFRHENQSSSASQSYSENPQLAVDPWGQFYISGCRARGNRHCDWCFSSIQRAPTMFGEYATLDAVPKVNAFSSTYKRTDIVFYVYWSSSQKAETRTKRGHGARRSLTDKGKMPSNWWSFLRDWSLHLSCWQNSWDAGLFLTF